MKVELSLKKIMLILFVGLIMFTPQFADYSLKGHEDLVEQQKVLASANPIMHEYYVSPTGDDSHSGNQTHPFLSLEKAQNATRVNISAGMTGDVIVYLTAGEYYLDSHLFFTEEDSGNNGFDVIYRNVGDQTPVIHGGQKISGWVEEGNGIWSVSTGIENFRQLYVNGKRATRARSDDASMILATNGVGHLLRNNDSEGWRNIEDIEVIYPRLWLFRRIFIDEIIGRQMIMQQPIFSWAKGDEPAWIENAYELMDEPGEWYLDRSENKLYYIPLPGENMATADVVIPVTEGLIRAEGTVDNKITHITLMGLSFRYDSWLRPSEIGGLYGRASGNYREVEGDMAPGTVRFKYATDIDIIGCDFSHLGAAAIDFLEGVNNSQIIGCRFTDLSSQAIRVGLTIGEKYDVDHPAGIRNILIQNNYISNTSRDYRSCPAINLERVTNVTVDHNTISNVYYAGLVSAGSRTRVNTVHSNITITHNHIYGVMTYLVDGGAIYTIGRHNNSLIAYNYIHDSGWNGLYPDEGTINSTWSYNVVHDTYNTFHDHSFTNLADNVITGNYLESYPKDYTTWDRARDKYQIWNLRPGSKGFPVDIVNNAGVEVEFQDMIPATEWYWKYDNSHLEDVRGKYPWLYYLGFGLITLGLAAGVFFIIGSSKIPAMKSEKKEGNAHE